MNAQNNKCDRCQSELVSDPSPDRHERALLCPECDFNPEAIKKYVEKIQEGMRHFGSDLFPRLETRKSKADFLEPINEMNPYLASVLELVDGDQSILRDYFLGAGAGKMILMSVARHRFIYKYAWSIPCKKALEAIAKYSPIVEVGAGTGYWAHLLHQMGVDVVAYDSTKRNHYEKTGLAFHKRWFDVKHGSEDVCERHSNRALFLCWPPLSDDMAVNCVRHHKGNAVLYVGEGAGGCTGSDEFFDYLESHFDREETVELPVWFGIHDRLFIFTRKQQR